MLTVLLIIVAIGILGTAFVRTSVRERRWRQIEREHRARDRWNA